MTKNNIINHAEGNSNTNNTNHCTDSVSSQQFCVRWNSHLGSLGAAFPQLLAGQRFVDVTLACEGHQLHCHRLVLAACSSYFESLLGENPCKHPIIILPRDIKLWEIQALVDFMYKGEVNVSQAGLSDLLKCAEILQIRGLSGTDSSVNLNQVGKESDFHINSPKLPQQQQEQKHNNNEMNDDKLFNQISGNSIQSSSLSAISNKNSTISQLLQIPKNKLVLSSLPSIVPSSSSIECIGQNINLSGQLLSNKTNTSSVQSLNQTNLNKNYLNMKDDLILNHQQDEKQQILPNQIEQSEKFNNQLRKILSENSTLFGQKNSKTIITNANNNFNNNNNNSNNNCWTNSKGNDYNNTNNNDSNINNSSIDIHLVNSLKRPSSKSNDSINNNKETINPYSTETQNSENNNDSNIINNNNNYKEETNNIINNNNNDKDKDENKNITNSKNDKEESNNITNANYDKDNYNSNSKIDNISNENDSNNINDDNRNNKNDNNINNDNNYNINNNNNEKDDNNNNSNKNDDYNNNKNDDDDNNNNDNNNSKNNNNDNPMEINFLTDNFENFKHNYNNDDHNNDLHEEEKRSLENSFNLAVAAVIAAASTSNLNKINKTINNNNILNVSCTNNIEEDLIDKNNDYINKINHNHKNNNNTQSLILKTEPMDTTSILEDETDDNSLCYNKIDGDDSDFLDSTIRSSDDVYDYDKNELRISMKNLPVGKKVRRSEAILRQAAECVSKGQTFQTVSDMFNIPISTIRFFMARKGILPRRKRGRSAGCSLIGSFNNNLTNELLSLAVSCGSGGITNTSIEDFQKLNTSPVTTTSLVTEVVASPSLSSSIMPSTAMHKISSKSIITTSVGTLLSTSISSSSSSSSLGIENIKDNINIEGTNNIFNYNESKNNLKPENSQTEIPFNFINYKLPDIKPKLL